MAQGMSSKPQLRAISRRISPLSRAYHVNTLKVHILAVSVRRGFVSADLHLFVKPHSQQEKMSETQACVLYYDRRSICSSMVRYTFALAGVPVQGSMPLSIKLKETQIFQGDQISEFYLCEVNPKGQVRIFHCASLHRCD